MYLCNEARVLLFGPYVIRPRLKIGNEKPEVIVHLCGCYQLDSETIIKEMYGVSAHVGRLLHRLLYLEQVLWSTCHL